jgi:hypothetical protein
MTQDFILIVKNPLKIDSKIFFNMNQYVKIIKIMNFSGAMIQLNNWEDTFKNEYSDVIETFDCHSNSRYDIHRICDCVKLQILKIPHGISPSQIIRFEIIIGGKIIWSIPFILLRTLCDIHIMDNYICLQFNEDIMGMSNNVTLQNKNIIDNCIPMIALQFATVQFHLYSELDFNYKVISTIRYYSYQRQELITLKHQYQINQYETHVFNGNNFRLGSNAITTGFFIEINGRKLKNLQISLDRNSFINYGKDEIEICGDLLFCIPTWSKKHSLILQFVLNKILPYDIIHIIESYVKKDTFSKYLYWIPVEPFKKWNVLNSKSYLHLKNLQVCFDMDGEYINGTIFILTKNILIIKDGFCAVNF